MSYAVHHFVGGEKLYATQLNEMDEEIKRQSDISDGVYHKVSTPVIKNLDPLASAKDGKYYLTETMGVPYTDALVVNGNSFYSEIPYDITNISGTLSITLSAVGEFHSSSGRRCLFTDSSGAVIFQSKAEKEIYTYDQTSDKYSVTFDIPEGASGFVWSLAVGAVIDSIVVDGIETTSTRRDKSKITEYVDILLPWNASRDYNKYYARGYIGQKYTQALLTNGNYMYAEKPIDVSEYAGCDVTITLSAVGAGHATAGGGACLFVDANDIIVSNTEPEKNLYTYDEETGKYTAVMQIPATASGFLWAMQYDNTVESMRVTGVVNGYNDTVRNTAYVSMTGYDTNDGTYAKPFATVTKALEAGYRDIRIFGGIYAQTIDLRKISTDECDIKISAVEHNNPVIFTPSDHIAKVTTATVYSGEVYQATITDEILSSCHYIYMDGVADPGTEITGADIHPSQRGNHYRCPDIVRIVKCNSIAEIEASNDYAWYADGNTLYFTAPSAPSANNPIVYAHTQAVQLFVQNDNVVIEPADKPARKFCIELNAVETRFMQMNLQGFQTATARNCRTVASPVWSGISLNRTQYAELINCESCCCNIDGIGGQNINTTTDNATAHNSFSRIVNCWSHDNYDDGYSEHDRSESIIIGGLYEWNGKAGVTPSYGEVCTCIDVYSRHNYQGFALVGSVGATGHVNGRNGSTLICYGCISDDNTRGTQQKGFVVMGDGNAAIFVNCAAMNETRGFCALGDVNMKLVNCSVVSCGTDKYTEGNPTIVVSNGTSVN